MQADTVERGQIVAREHLLEAVVVERATGIEVVRQPAGMRGVRRIEIGADEPAAIGRRVDGDGDALAKTELTMRGGVIHVVAGQTAQQQAKPLINRRCLPVIAVGVSDPGDIAFAPDIAHGRRSFLSIVSDRTTETLTER